MKLLNIFKYIIISFLCLTIIVTIVSPKKMFVVSMIVGGKFISPEGSSMLCHYCFGNGDTLEINSHYISKSPVLLKNIKGMKVGQTKKVWFKQSEDWRLSYSFNPFMLKRTKNGYLVYQYIKFDTSNKIYTDINLKFTKLRVHDNVVHTFNCTPYVAICKIEN